MAWHCADASAYYLDLGPTEGSNTYLDSGSLSSSTYVVFGDEPAHEREHGVGAMVLQRRWNLDYVDYSYTAYSGGIPGDATLTTPTPNNSMPPMLSGSTVTFDWSTAAGAYAYYLDIGTMSNLNAYYSQNQGTGTMATVSGLPINGSTVLVTLYTQFSAGGTWYSNQYTFEAYSVSALQAVLTSPAPNNSMPPMLPDSSVTFTWSTGTGAYAYYLDVGTTGQANHYYSANQGTGTSVTVYGLPIDGSTVVVTVYTQFTMNGTWYPNAYNFTALNPSVDNAMMQTPMPNTTLSGSSVTFTWSTGTGAYAYYLDVGNNTSVNAYYSQNQGNGTSVTVNTLPTDGSAVVVTLYTQYTNGGTWYSNTYNYTAQ